MARGITHSCAHIWRHVARAGGWWSVLRIAREWDGVFSMDEIAEHLVTLQRGGFLAALAQRREGTVYAFTTQCRPLPGETLIAVTAPASASAPDPEPAAVALAACKAPQPDVMRSTYVPPQSTYRQGSQDHTQCPSLHMGKRTPYRSTK